jgi:hypothetical protein
MAFISYVGDGRFSHSDFVYDDYYVRLSCKGLQPVIDVRVAATHVVVPAFPLSQVIISCIHIWELSDITARERKGSLSDQDVD